MIGCPDCDVQSMDDENLMQLERLRTVLEVARRNGNQLFIDNIEREIAALERGDCSPIVEEYLTEEERSCGSAVPHQICRRRCAEVQPRWCCWRILALRVSTVTPSLTGSMAG